MPVTIRRKRREYEDEYYKPKTDVCICKNWPADSQTVLSKPIGIPLYTVPNQ